MKVDKLANKNNGNKLDEEKFNFLFYLKNDLPSFVPFAWPMLLASGLGRCKSQQSHVPAGPSGPAEESVRWIGG